MIPLMRIAGNEKMDELLGFLRPGITMVEVGCWAGESTRRFAETGKVSRLYAVDCWKPWDISGDPYLMSALGSGMSQAAMDEVEKEFDKRVSSFGDVVRKTKGKSVEMAKGFDKESVDFVYLDANHGYESVRSDIEAWLPKVRVGGAIGGHDYGKAEFPGVKRAVDEKFGGSVRVFPDSSWAAVVGRKERIAVLTFCYNESFLMPYFLKHYSFADRIHAIVDADTNDGTREQLASRPRVTTEEYRFPDMMDDVLKAAKVSEASRSMDADWVIVVDVDEFVFSARGESVSEFLARQPREFNVVVSRMWQVYRHRTDSDLSLDCPSVVAQRRHGDPMRERGKNIMYCKPIVVRLPRMFEFKPGNHLIRGEGLAFSRETLDGVHWMMADSCFAVDRRIAGRRARQSKENIRLGLTVQHHHVTEEEITEECRRHLDDPLLF